MDKNETLLYETNDWLQDRRHQTVLKTMHTIAYEFNPETGEEIVSPFINQYLAGNYDGRLLSHVMVEDQVIHPDDLKKSLDFREAVKKGDADEISIRLRTPEGPYHWFKMKISPYEASDGSIRYIGTFTNIDNEIHQQEALRYRAEYDLVTGIYNKVTFYTVTGNWLGSEPDITRCLISFDIDRFKIINETYSLSEGDKVLCHIAKLLKQMTYSGETYARNNSDIFYVCLSRPKKEAAEFVLELEHLLNKYPLDFQFTLSAGIVHIPHYNGEPLNVLCDWAAMAQNTVKGSYIHRYAFYEEAMSNDLNKEHYITKNMAHALENHEFQMYLQPKYDMRTHTIIGAEALSRWHHPKDGILPPSDFIPLFERNGFIIQMDEYIWETACKTIRRWLDEGKKPITISVNVSRVHLHDPELCSKLISLVRKYDLPPHSIELEITESAYVDNPDALYDIMDKLQEAGFLFSMDDFGSGYSSLNALKDIPVDVVKIDLNFLQKARRGLQVGRDILKGVIQMIQGIQLPVIAEGVENKEQADFLLNAGCVHAQGYYYAKPMSVSDFEQLLSGKETAI